MKIEASGVDVGPPPSPQAPAAPDKWFRLHLTVDEDPNAKVVLCVSPRARQLLPGYTPFEVGGNIANALSKMLVEFYGDIKP